MGKLRLKPQNDQLNNLKWASKVAIKLPMEFDASRLQEDLKTVEKLQRVSQPGPYHNGEWAGVSLYSSGGISTKASPGPGFEPFQETDVLKKTPYFKEVLDGLLCPKLAVRLLWLPPEGKIGQHSDGIIGFNSGFLRLHIPVVTHPDVIFLISNQRCSWQPGELWYGDFSQVHSVENKSQIERAHIVLDVEINDFILGLFPPDFIQAKRATGISMRKPILDYSQEELKQYECDFKMPKDKLPIQPGKQTPTDDASIRLIDNRLAFVVNGKPELSLQPISKTAFSFAGCPSLGLQCQMSSGKVSQLSFLFRRGSKKEDYIVKIPVYHN
jgi:hypothetical protein